MNLKNSQKSGIQNQNLLHHEDEFVNQMHWWHPDYEVQNEENAETSVNAELQDAELVIEL